MSRTNHTPTSPLSSSSSPTIRAINTMPRSASPRYQPASRYERNNEKTSPPISSANSKTSQSRSQRDELVRHSDYGPYSHLQTSSKGSMSTQTYKGSLDSRTKNGSSSSTMNQKLTLSSVLYPTTYKHSKDDPEHDDYLYEGEDESSTAKFIFCSARGFTNVLVLTVLILGLLTLFAGYPLISHFTKKPPSKMGAFGIGGTNGTGQVPVIPSSLKLVDPETPSASTTWKSPYSKDSFHLVFSDEFNTPGRTFWPGDDPYWTAVDLWYGATGDYEWYTPEQINTTDGHLQITMDNKPMHNLNFRSGMLQSWNKFCFQGGYIEFSIVLPGTPDEIGFWPGSWLMGNLARPGYLGTTDGMWPYSYNSCDSGILHNQTAPGRTGYDDVISNDLHNKMGLSWLRGMRTPACTCNASEHPGPNPNVGRSAPELDIIEAQIKLNAGQASQSFQIAPFDLAYDWNQSTVVIYNEGAGATEINSYTGGVYQEAVSATTVIPDAGYALVDNEFTTYGVEYEPDWDKNGGGYITWYLNGQPTFAVTGDAFPARPDIDISQRLIPTEPMAIIMNLGMSRGFQSNLDFSTLTFPAVMKVDYVRLYQNDNTIKDLVSCDPADHPTAAYIEQYTEVYNNPNHTTWPNDVPKNTLTGC